MSASLASLQPDLGVRRQLRLVRGAMEAEVPNACKASITSSTRRAMARAAFPDLPSVKTFRRSYRGFPTGPTTLDPTLSELLPQDLIPTVAPPESLDARENFWVALFCCHCGRFGSGLVCHPGRKFYKAIPWNTLSLKCALQGKPHVR